MQVFALLFMMAIGYRRGKSHGKVSPRKAPSIVLSIPESRLRETNKVPRAVERPVTSAQVTFP